MFTTKPTQPSLEEARLLLLTQVLREIRLLARDTDTEHLFERFNQLFQAKLAETENRIMSAISEFASKQAQFNARIGTAIDGIVADIADLNATIQELQESQGHVTPEDQALIDDLVAKGEALAARITAVDEMNPPTPPAG